VLATTIKRMEGLERLAAGARGVEKAYAVQAGREVRVIVAAGEVSEGQALVLSHELARKIEREATYPGEVRVTVVREARASEVAR
jgi:ribonuclease Y